MRPRFSFKGNRNYLHSTTIFDFILDAYFSDRSSPSEIDFFMHKLTSNLCDLLPASDGGYETKSIVGEFRSNEENILILETNEPITDTTPYEEESIIDHSVITTNVIEIPKESNGFTQIERVVGGYKLLLQNIHGDQYGKFLFARLVLEVIPLGDFSICYNRLISKRYFEGAIFVGREELGKIYFGVQAT